MLEGPLPVLEAPECAAGVCLVLAEAQGSLGSARPAGGRMGMCQVTGEPADGCWGWWQSAR